MEHKLPFLNFSLSRLLSTVGDSLSRARIKILLVILFFSLLKVCVVIPVAVYYQQYFHAGRASVLLGVYLVMFKLLLANKNYTKPITHIMVWIGLLLIWSNILYSVQDINVITVQFILMLVLSSFYMLNNFYGILYSCISILPVLLFYLFGDSILPQNKIDELVLPGAQTLIILNFATIVVAHYLFSKAFNSNINEKEILNKQLQLALKEANRATEMKSDFLSTMSHELRTPLNSILGISELMLNEPQTKEQEENLKILKFSAENLQSLVNDILDYNKLGSEKLHLEKLPVELYELVQNLCFGLRFQAKQKDIDFIVDIDENLKGKRVITDPTRLTQIIYNLAGNAVKFTDAGSVTISLKTLKAGKDHLQVKFCVNDTGIGISADKQEVIFEPFTQESSSTTRKFGGTGLGLAIVKRLLALFDSKILLTSAPGKGSQFCFEITFDVDTESKTDIPAVTLKKADLSHIKILVAEDNAMNRLLLSKTLSNWNNYPVFVTSGTEAVEELIRNNYDVILMDLHMPGMNGYEAARAIRAMDDPAKANVEIIAITAAVTENLMEKISEAGMNDFILKPFKINDLLAKLNNIQLKA